MATQGEVLTAMEPGRWMTTSEIAERIGIAPAEVLFALYGLCARRRVDRRRYAADPRRHEYALPEAPL